MHKTIAVTGANGFIGTGLIKHLSAVGYKTIALVHRMPENKVFDVEYHCYELNTRPDATLFTNVDVLIHLAFTFNRPQKNEPDINIIAAEALLDLNLKQYIFISSFSASPSANSYYGKCKHELETIFAGHTIIRPGLVVGDGGLFSRIATQIESNPFIPLVAGGKQPMQLIALPDLIIAIEKILSNDIPGIFNLAHPDAITYKEMILLASSRSKTKPIFITLPITLLRVIIKVANLLGKRNISEDNLDGLINSHIVNTNNSLLKVKLDLPATGELMKQVSRIAK